ncbi:hypothetical protein [Pseudomonas sp. W03]|uniref:hypothetical protein n=1 Tax=Pseudomonas sp. W03 TaxID=3090666 RepID=UPI003A4E5201
MKDMKLFDDTLVALLRMPDEHRTTEVIASHLALAASAANLGPKGQTTLQLEHLQLASAAALLTKELGEGFTHRTNLRIGPGLDGIELFASIEAGGGGQPRFTGFGPNAARVLGQLRQQIEDYAKPPAERQKKPREANRSPLRHLPSKRHKETA